jgi:HlyD family secretion protein
VALNCLSETLTKVVAALTKAAQSQSQNNQGQNNQGQNNQNNQSSQNQSQSSANTGSANTGSADTGSADTGSDASGGTITAARLAQDQADIDTADAQLGEARAARGLATLRAPYAGRVLQVGLAKGDQVSASDTPVVLVGRGVTTVTTTVSNAQVPDVRRGQSVTVTPAGWTSPMKGTVTEIAVLPDSSGNYAVTVTVESARTVSEGSTASVSIVTGVAKDAVTVPTSALTRNGTRAVVQVLHGQVVTRTSVTVGVVGTRRASITQGLKVGAKVVLADLAAKVPTSDNTNNQNRFRRGVELGGGPQVQFSRG